MTISVICPHCGKTVKVERTARLTCPECGTEFGYAELQKKQLIVDFKAESSSLSAAKELFKNAEFTGAQKLFAKALEANPNSFYAQYFVSLCEIYNHEGDPDYDVVGNAVNTLRSALEVMLRSAASIEDKLTFAVAMLNEIKIITTRRLTTREELFATNVEEFRKVTVFDLSKLESLFKLDSELIMSFSPDVKTILLEIAECAIKVCYKAVQTVAVGEELHSPTKDEYIKLSALCNNYCFFAHSLDPEFDTTVFSPDFSQNSMYNEKVLSMLTKFAESNWQYEKKYLIGNIAEYDGILAECEKALHFTYLSCYRSLCSRQTSQHADLFYSGLQLAFKLLLPRVVMNSDKKVEIHLGKFVDIVDWCDILTRFIVDAYELNPVVGESLHAFYENLYAIVDAYVVPEIDKIGKYINKLKQDRGDEYFFAQKLLFDAACCCVPALTKYVDFSDGSDKPREKLVKICKQAVDDFLLLSDYKIEELDQSNFYRPIIQISSALMDEEEE